MRAGLFVSVAAIACGVPGMDVPAGRGISLLADVADRQLRDGPPQRVIRREDAVIAVPVPPRLRDEVGEPVEELKWGKLDDAAGPACGRKLENAVLLALPRRGAAAVFATAPHASTSFRRQYRPLGGRLRAKCHESRRYPALRFWRVRWTPCLSGVFSHVSRSRTPSRMR